MKYYKNNPRQISKKRYAQLEKSLGKHGDLSGIVHNLESDEIVGGNQRAHVFGLARSITIEHEFDEPTRCGTVRTGYIEWKGERFSYRAVRWDAETEAEANIKANALGGAWDWDVLSGWDTAKLLDWGIDTDKLKEWNDNAASFALMVESEVEEEHEEPEARVDIADQLQEKWKVKTGDLWEIGDHRLICGDCTDMSVVESVSCGDDIKACISDPPYGISYDRNKKHKGSTSNPNIIGDGIDFDPRWMLKYERLILWGGNCYASRLPDSPTWLAWKKTTTDGKKSQSADFELAWSNCIGRSKFIEYLWSGYYRAGESGDFFHTTQKPVEVMEWCIDMIDDRLILDPYAGSGTTAVACQNLGRKARLIEIEPKYCAVILERLSKMGLTPQLVIQA